MPGSCLLISMGDTEQCWVLKSPSTDLKTYWQPVAGKATGYRYSRKACQVKEIRKARRAVHRLGIEIGKGRSRTGRRGRHQRIYSRQYLPRLLDYGSPRPVSLDVIGRAQKSSLQHTITYTATEFLAAGLEILLVICVGLGNDDS